MATDQTLSPETTVPSSSAPAIFSDDATHPSSPPSSPPGFPWEHDDAPKCSPHPPQKSAFSLLGKRKALSSVSDNVRPPKRTATATKSANKPALSQMQISLGQEVQKRCRTCGMEYVPSSAEDRKLHDKYHKQNTEGFDVGKDFVRDAREGAICVGARKGDSICMVDCFDKPGRKRKAQAVLEIVQRELGAVPIDEESIWDPKKQNAQAARYRSYLYVRDTKCIGYLFVQRIEKAWEVVASKACTVKQPEADVTEKSNARNTNALSALRRRRELAARELQRAESAPIELLKTPRKAALGISRIWTSSAHRRQNIATTLLDAALLETSPRNDAEKSEEREAAFPEHAPGRREMERKGLVAFSQPTESGAKLARKWFGKPYGWSVYVD